MKLRITVHGVPYEVDVEVLDAGEGFAPAPLPQVSSSRPSANVPGPAPQSMLPPKPAAGPAGGSSRSVASPIAGNVVEVKTAAGATVKQGDVLLVIEAMKMNTSIAAPAAGAVRAVKVAAGDAVREGQVLVEFE